MTVESIGAYVSFELKMGSDGHSIPDWKWREKPVLVRINLEALARLYGGPIPEAMTPDRVFADIRTTVENVAMRKLNASGGDFTEPLTITTADL